MFPLNLYLGWRTGRKEGSINFCRGINHTDPKDLYIFSYIRSYFFFILIEANKDIYLLSILIVHFFFCYFYFDLIVLSRSRLVRF